MTEPTDVEGLVKLLKGHRVYHLGQARAQGYSPLSTATGHTELARVLEEAAAALSTLSTQLEEARRDARARSQPGYGECSLASADAEPSGAWRPIESAPKDGTSVLLFARGRDDVMETGHWRADRERWVINNNAFWVVEPTHWQPLPPPPPALLKEPSHG